MTPQEIEAHFTTRGGFAFARWRRAIAPVVFGVDEATLSVVKGAIEAMAVLAGHPMAETDPEQGANLMFFFFREWEELEAVPDLDRLVPEIGGLAARMTAAGAEQYRYMRFEANGAIRAAFVFVRMGGALAEMAAADIALAQAAQVMLRWGERAFSEQSPLGRLPSGVSVLRPEIAALIRAAYDSVLPVASEDPALALRLFARLQGKD